LAITDDFNRADAGDLGANWTELVDGLKVASNRCAAVNDNVYQPAYYSGSSWGSDQSAQVTLGASFTDAGPVINAGPGNNYYMGMASASAGMRIYRVDSGSFTLLDGIGGSVTTGDLIKLGRSGGTVTYYKNGVSQGSVSDSTYTGGSPGLYLRNNTSGESLDDWVGTGESGGGGAKAPPVFRRSQRFMRRRGF
jgi:hypothetical protein